MPTKRKQYKKHITKTQKKGRNGRKITKRNKHSRKFRTMRNKKYSGGGTWIDVAGDECPICLQHFSETPNLAIYKTHCRHIFHNNCLNRACDARVLRCPICRSELEKAAIGNEPARADCTEVRAFATKRLDNPNILDEKNRAIYDAQPEHEEEVFRVNPVVGTCYDHVEATRRVGRYPHIRYFAPSLNRVYVGRFVREERRGFGDGQQIYAIFVNNNGQERRVQYSYGGDTCFIEVPCH